MSLSNDLESVPRIFFLWIFNRILMNIFVPATISGGRDPERLGVEHVGNQSSDLREKTKARIDEIATN
jgi:hypothetical protein